MKSTMTHQFSQVPSANISRSSFDLSHGYKTTFDSSYLIPVLVMEALPGDTHNVSLTALARLATPLKPVMDNMQLRSEFFSVPYRLVWDNWQRFNGEQTNPADSTDYLIPTMTSPAEGYANGSVYDYMGIPTQVGLLEHDALFLRAQNLIWNEWYRDENLQDSIIVPTDDGPDDVNDYTLLRRNKRFDYFTSGLPWPQKGPAVEIPLGTSAPLMGSVTATGFGTAEPTFINVASNSSVGTIRGKTGDSNINTSIQSTQAGNLKWNESQLQTVLSNSSAYADLSEATSATINALRLSFQVQKLYERDARGGTRYVEILLSHFGVVSPDQRLQRPEYLGGSVTPINITSVPQNSGTALDPETGYTESPQGNLAAFGTAMASGHGFTKSFTEHCLIIGFISVQADITYQSSLNRMWSRQTRWDFFWPALQNIGEQEVLNKEIFAQGAGSPDDDGIFCYQERYAEYRYFPSLITGQFRSNYAQSLDIWHLSQDFENLPVLNSQFIEENPPIDRVIAVQNEPQFLFDGYFKIRSARPMPVYSVPGLIDHF